jgi:hypothetical protein
LREPARLPRRVSENKKYTETTTGPATYAKTRQHASREHDG